MAGVTRYCSYPPEARRKRSGSGLSRPDRRTDPESRSRSHHRLRSVLRERIRAAGWAGPPGFRPWTSASGSRKSARSSEKSGRSSARTSEAGILARALTDKAARVAPPPAGRRPAARLPPAPGGPLDLRAGQYFTDLDRKGGRNERRPAWRRSWLEYSDRPGPGRSGRHRLAPSPPSSNGRGPWLNSRRACRPRRPSATDGSSAWTKTRPAVRSRGCSIRLSSGEAFSASGKISSGANRGEGVR